MLLLFVRVLYLLQIKLSRAPLFLLYNADALNNYIVISQLSIACSLIVFGPDN